MNNSDKPQCGCVSVWVCECVGQEYYWSHRQIAVSQWCVTVENGNSAGNGRRNRKRLVRSPPRLPWQPVIDFFSLAVTIQQIKLRISCAENGNYYPIPLHSTFGSLSTPSSFTAVAYFILIVLLLDIQPVGRLNHHYGIINNVFTNHPPCSNAKTKKFNIYSRKL